MFNLLYLKRVQKGWTQQMLAEQAGVSRRTVCSIENAGKIPTTRIGIRLCRALGCSFEEVFPIDVSLREL